MSVSFQRSGTFINKIVLRTYTPGDPEYGVNGMAIEFADGSAPILVFGFNNDAISDPYYVGDHYGTTIVSLNAPNGFDELRIGKNSFPNLSGPIKNMAIYLNGILVDKFISVYNSCCGDTKNAYGVLINPQNYTKTFKLNSIANGIAAFQFGNSTLTDNPIVEILNDESVINGGVSSWSDWGECVLDSNGVLKKTRSRLCNNPTPANGGANCIDSLIDTEVCPPINGGLSEWSNWSECALDTDQIFKKMRRKRCNNPTPSNGGDNCGVLPVEIELCPINGVLSYSPIVATVSSSRDSPAVYTVSSSGGSSGGGSNITPDLSQPHDNLINGVLGDWGNWGECVKDTGGNYKRSRTKICTNPANVNGVAYCGATAIEEESCSNSTSDNSILSLLFIILIFVAVIAGGYFLYKKVSSKKIGGFYDVDSEFTEYSD